MDDMNINGNHLEEIEVNAEGEKWIRLNWKENASDDKESQSTEKESETETLLKETKESDIKKPNTEAEDDGISVITESDEDNKNEKNAIQVCPVSYSRLFQVVQMLERRNNIKVNIWNIIGFTFGFTFILGFFSGCIFCYICNVVLADIKCDTFVTDSLKNISAQVKLCSSDFANLTEKLQTEYRKEMEIMEAIQEALNKVEARIPDNTELLTQLSQLTDFFNQTNGKFSINTSEYFNEKTRPLNDLRISLHLLSLLTFIHNNNNSLENEMMNINETLNIINNTKTFYEALISLDDNNTQNIHNSTVLKFLQHDGDKIANASKSFLSDIKKAVNKIIFHTNKKYIKIRNKLNKRLCYLKNQYPDDKGLKVTANNQLFDDKYCLVRKNSQNLNDKIATKDDAKYKNNNQKKKHYNQQDNSFERKVQDMDDFATLKLKNKPTKDKVHHKSQVSLCSTNCPEYNDNMDTADTASKNHKSKSFVVASNDKYDPSSTKAPELERKNSKLQFAEEKKRPIEKDIFWISFKKVSDHVDASTESKDTSLQKKVEDHKSKGCHPKSVFCD